MFGNRDEAAPMGGVMVDVKGDVWMQQRQLGAAREGGGGRQRQWRGERRGDFGPVQSPSMVFSSYVTCIVIVFISKKSHNLLATC